MFLYIQEEGIGMPLPVLWQDDHILICEKPSGISSESPGLPDLIAQQAGRKVYPVHRLDRGTGGVVVLALSLEAAAAMQRLFLQDLVRKEYLAVVSGCPETDSGTYTDLLFHDRKTNRTFVVDRLRKGVREAFCEWSVLASAADGGQVLSLVKVSLHTGRTHQIRVQFGSRGFPLVGDRKYGSRLPAENVSLWASAISFPSPDQKSGSVSVASLPPDVFPWNLFDLSSV